MREHYCLYFLSLKPKAVHRHSTELARSRLPSRQPIHVRASRWSVRLEAKKSGDETSLPARDNAPRRLGRFAKLWRGRFE